MSIIEFKHVSKAYDQVLVIKDLSLCIPKGEFVTILGPSGCGKTTLLKMVNKMVPFSEGTITVKDKDLQAWDKISLRRSIGYVIQQIGLLPHLTIRKNITFVLDIQKKDKIIQSQTPEELMDLVGLDMEMLDRYPRELSGGQKQRVGVARALAANPEIILMDEPFGAVDEIARTILQDELIKIHKKLKKTILFVTHDIQEALKLGGMIVLMDHGEIVQTGTKEALVFHPDNDFVKKFLGIKGFQSSLDKTVMQEVYDRMLNREITIEDFYDMIHKTVKEKSGGA